MEFAKCSLPPEKQKLVAFYSSANTLKGLRKKIDDAFEKTKKYSKDKSIVTYDEYEQVCEVPDVIVHEQRSFSQSNTENVKDRSITNNQNIQSKSKMMADSYYQNTVAEKKTLPFTSIEPKYMSQQVPEQKSINTISIKSGAFATKNESSRTYKVNDDIVTAEFSHQDKELVRSCDRMEESLKYHLDAYKGKIFNSEDLVFSKDRNLISNNHAANSQKASQYLDSLQRKTRRGTEGVSVRQPQRSIKSAAHSKADLREKVRIYTSNCARSKVNLVRDEDNEYDKRCRTAAFNTRTNFQNKIVIDNAEEELKEIMNCPTSKDVCSINQGSSPQYTRPSTMAQSRNKDYSLTKFDKSILRNMDKDLLEFYSNTKSSRHYKMKEIHDKLKKHQKYMAQFYSQEGLNPTERNKIDSYSNSKQNGTYNQIQLHRYSKTGGPRNYDQNIAILEEENNSRDYTSKYEEFQRSVGSRFQKGPY